MEPLTRDLLDALAKITTHPAISIYFPISVGEKKKAQNEIKIKKITNYLGKNIFLKLNDDKIISIRKYLSDSFKKVKNKKNLKYHGFAIFLSSDSSFVFPLHFNIKFLIDVDKNFNLVPLLKETKLLDRYFISSTSQSKNELLEFKSGRFIKINLKNLPNSIRSFQRSGNKYPQLHAVNSQQSVGTRRATFYIENDYRNRKKIALERYVKKICQETKRYLKNKKGFQILNSVDPIIGMYRKYNLNSNLLKEVIYGNPEIISIEELKTKVYEIIFFSPKKGELGELVQTDQI